MKKRPRKMHQRVKLSVRRMRVVRVRMMRVMEMTMMLTVMESRAVVVAVVAAAVQTFVRVMQFHVSMNWMAV